MLAKWKEKKAKGKKWSKEVYVVKVSIMTSSGGSKFGSIILHMKRHS